MPGKLPSQGERLKRREKLVFDEGKSFRPAKSAGDHLGLHRFFGENFGYFYPKLFSQDSSPYLLVRAFSKS